ncbi:MAG: hypothetical protein U0234_25735 [Sandaracinus sp.]
MGRPLAALAWMLIVGSLAGCVVYDPALVSGGSCGRHPPTRPTGENTSQDGDVVFGLRDVVLQQTAAQARMLGYDVDGLCTDSTNRATECTPGMGAPVAIDGDQGVDNQFGASLYPLVEAAVPGLEGRARAAQMAGNGLPVLRIRGWNRMPNDPVVDVVITAAVFSAAGTGQTSAPEVTIHSPTDYTLANGDPVPAPAWDGQDWVWVRDDSFLSGDLEMPLVRDEQAYVTNGTVVAHLPERVDIVFPTDTTGVLVRLTDAVATGQISEDGTMLTNVIVAGRWSTTDLLSTAENVGLCRGTAQYQILQSQLGRLADVRSTPPAAGDPMLDCDALSIGVGFTGFAMRVAGVTTGLTIENQCLNNDAGATGDAGAPDAGTSAMDAGVDAAVHDAGVDAHEVDANDVDTN